MTNLYPYSVRMLNMGRFAYLHQITNCLVRIKETEEFLNDSNDYVREDAALLIEELREEIEEIEQRAEERYSDWATD